MSTPVGHTRKNPGQRREEILAAAAEIALREGLERITVRAVAERVGVRPGLISHYYPAAQHLVVAAFERAVSIERADALAVGGTPTERLARFVAFVSSEAAAPLSRLWLNARHLSRFAPALAAAVAAQEDVYLRRTIEIVVAGVACGEFDTTDAETAAVRILMAVDATTTYVNDPPGPGRVGYATFVADVATWVLGMTDGALTA